MKVLVTLSKGHPLLFDEIGAIEPRHRATRMRALAELGLRVERGMGAAHVAKPLARETLERPATGVSRSAIAGFGDD